MSIYICCAHITDIESVRFLIPASLSLRSVGACFSHNKHFPGGGEVTEDLVKWALNMAKQICYDYYFVNDISYPLLKSHPLP